MINATLKGMHHVLTTDRFGEGMTLRYLDNHTMTDLREFCRNNNIKISRTKQDTISNIYNAASNYTEEI